MRRVVLKSLRSTDFCVDVGSNFSDWLTSSRSFFRVSSKSRTEYVAFLNEEGCAHLKYHEERVKRGEKLTKYSPIMVPRNSRTPDHITTNAVTSTIRTAFRNAKLSSRPYELRSYFETRMEEAEADGVILKDWRKQPT